MLGAGNVAESYVRQIRRLREEGVNVELAAICSRSLDPARRLAEIFGIAESGTDIAALLSRKDIDAVIVLTPMQCHAEHVRLALASGKHVLSEKTLAASAEEGCGIAALAAERGLLLRAAPFTTLSPVFRDARHRLERGEIGEALCCRALYGWEGPDWADWFFRPGAGALRDLGVYALTTLTGLLGPVASVFAQASEVKPDDHGQGLQLSLRFTSGCVGTITTGFGLRKFQTSGIEIYGSAGTLQFVGQDWDPKGLQLWTAETGCWRLFEEDATWPWTDGVRDFCASIIEGASGDLSIDHVLHVLDIIDQALASLDCGMPMAVASRFAPPSLRSRLDMNKSHRIHNPLTLT
jgi:predicted dehydrogenase